jgi:hypothetical protein
MTALVGTLEGAAAEISMSIWVVEATGLLSFTTSGFGKGSGRSGNASDDIDDNAEVFRRETGSSLPIVLIAVEMVTAVDNVDIVPGSWAFKSPFICVTLMGEVAEWSTAMLTSVIKEGIAEISTKDKGAPTISEAVEWSAVVPMLALVAKEGITEGSTNEGAALISGVAGWLAKDMVTSSIGTTPAT